MTVEDKYTETVERLFERHRSVQTAGFSSDAYKPGLGQMFDYAGFLGDPQLRWRGVHVAGTNGKGSVCSMLAAAFAAGGVKTGLYTSPHLVDFRERIKVLAALAQAAETGSGELRFAHPSQPAGWAPPVHVATGGYGSPSRSPLPQAEASESPPDNVATGGYGSPSRSPLPQAEASESSLDNAATDCHGSPSGAPLPEAEMIPREEVCDFLEHYDREGLSFFEVTTGLAFKWFADSGVDVAVIETGLGGRLDSTNIITPVISIITSIGLDHCALLGSTRAEIAAEKAGIFKPGVPALVWGRDPETQPVFENAAAEAGCPLYYAEDFPVPEDFPPLDLTGPCQDVNLRTVLAALTILGASPLRPEVRRAIAAAARITGLRGRWEIVLREPLTICDIAHNPPALEVNMVRLASLRGAPKCPLLIVFGAMADKDEDSVAALLPQDAEYYLVRPATPRAMKESDLALKLKRKRFLVQSSVAAGVQAALDRAKLLPDPIIYIGGSTYVVSEAISYLESV